MPEATQESRRVETIQLLRYLLRWLLLAPVAGVLAGSASALLLVSLEWATRTRDQHRWIIACLPIAGLFVGWLYHWIGRSVEAGSNLVLDEIHDARNTIPLRMTPLILIGTFVTHLFGGSAGREGTAIQTGASLADQIARRLRLQPHIRRILLMAGMSAGFGSVFGTPLAGAIFGIEVLTVGSLSYEAIVPCFLASFAGDLTTRAWGIHHTTYQMALAPSPNAGRLALAALAGVAFGLAGRLFGAATHAVAHFFRGHVRWPPLRPLIGGCIVAAIVFLTGTTKYIGLGLPTITGSFTEPQPTYAWAAKLALTAITLGAGFKGGEVTPLFFVGATLGNALSRVLPLPVSLLAGMGFASVFAGAANTPLASTLLAIELFGGGAGGYAGIACVFSYVVSGHSGIYRAQRVGHRKHSEGARDLP